MSKSSRFFFQAWRPTLAVLALALITYVLYFHNIRHLLPGYAGAELQTYHSAANWHTIWHDPINLPYKALIWLAVALGHHSILITRIVAASFGVIGVLVFFLIARQWYGFRTAFLGTVLFASSAGFLHLARLGSPQILQLSILAILGLLLWYLRAKRPLAGYVLVVLCALLWYVPGMIWFEFFGLVLLRAGVIRRLKQADTRHQAAWVVLFLALIAPLVIASIHNSQVALQAIGLPTDLGTLKHAASNLADTLLGIGVYGHADALVRVGHTPLLNAIELILAAAGVYYYAWRDRSLRMVFLAGASIISLVLIALGGLVTYAVLLPLLYLFVACGLNHLLGQWLAVFPRNPVARAAGIAVICTMLFFSVLYQTRSYFVAWPHNGATRQTFSHQQP
jgi:hypothetical protein